MKLPTWFIDALESDSDKELAKEGKLKALDKVIVCCQKCGKRIETIVKSKIVPANVNNPDYKIMCKCCAQRNDDELIGKRFGQLVVIKELAPDKDDNNQSRHRKVLCQCDCGKLVTPFLKNLRRGISTSCGKHRSKKTVIQHDIINKENSEVLNDIGKVEKKKKEIVKSKSNCEYAKKNKNSLDVLSDYKQLTKEQSESLMSKPVMADVIEFVERRFPTAKNDPQWVSGNCYYFAVMLKDRFPDGWIVYDVIDGHFMFLYKKMLIDAVHHEFLKDDIIPSENDYCVNGHIVVWDFFDRYDPLQYQRVIRDCIK